MYQLLSWTVLFLTYATRTSVNSVKFYVNCARLQPRIAGNWRKSLGTLEHTRHGPLLYLFVCPIPLSSRGPFGAVLRGTNDDGLLPPRHIFIVAAGLNSTDYDAADAHAQFSEISYLEPSMYHEDENEQYHYMIYHLKTPFDFKTPYVKAICLLEEIKDFKTPLFGFEGISSGFAVRTFKESVAELKISVVEFLSEDLCSSYFRFHYRRELNESQVVCGAKKGNGSEVVSTSLEFLKNITRDSDPNLGSEEFCFLHGSVVFFELSTQWFLATVVTLIPGRKKGQCNDQNVYIYGRIGAHINWLVSSMTCSPEFACEDEAKTCIPIKTVCNGVDNCPSGKDEQERFCKAQDECNLYTKKPMHSCGITGKCILKSELCNGKPDCDDGSDEEIELCASNPKNNFGLTLRSSGKKCPTLELPKV
ncbi:unnamed protein product [Allacma fusca]|uniref:Uncharacterized protein n=1 Tax=Allacma fusca TaxID=39272 RepID=A0A8J2K4W5_9HEXA|nr:unnamed protein product [Allacma fusca]